MNGLGERIGKATTAVELQCRAKTSRSPCSNARPELQNYTRLHLSGRPDPGQRRLAVRSRTHRTRPDCQPWKGIRHATLTVKPFTPLTDTKGPLPAVPPLDLPTLRIDRGPGAPYHPR